MNLVDVRAINLVLQLFDKFCAFNIECLRVNFFVTTASSIVSALGFESPSSATFLIELAVATFSLDKLLCLQILVTLSLCSRLAGSTFFVIGEEETC